MLGFTGGIDQMRSCIVGFSMIVIGVTSNSSMAVQPEKSTNEFKGAEANVEYDLSSGDCIFGFAYVQGFKSTINGVSETYVQASGNVSDFCEGVNLLSFFGNSIVPDSNVIVNKKGTSATVTTNIEGYDYVREQPIQIEVNLNWLASGPAERFHSNNHNKSLGYLSKSSSRGLFAPATVAGRFSHGTTEFGEYPVSFANIGVGTFSSISIVKSK